MLSPRQYEHAGCELGRLFDLYNIFHLGIMLKSADVITFVRTSFACVMLATVFLLSCASSTSFVHATMNLLYPHVDRICETKMR